MGAAQCMPVGRHTPNAVAFGAFMQTLLCSSVVSGLASQSGRDAETAKKSQTLVCSTTQRLTVGDDYLWLCHVWLKVAHRRYNSSLHYSKEGWAEAHARVSTLVLGQLDTSPLGGSPVATSPSS